MGPMSEESKQQQRDETPENPASDKITIRLALRAYGQDLLELLTAPTAFFVRKEQEAQARGPQEGLMHALTFGLLTHWWTKTIRSYLLGPRAPQEWRPWFPEDTWDEDWESSFSFMKSTSEHWLSQLMVVALDPFFQLALCCASALVIGMGARLFVSKDRLGSVDLSLSKALQLSAHTLGASLLLLLPGDLGETLYPLTLLVLLWKGTQVVYGCSALRTLGIVFFPQVMTVFLLLYYGLQFIRALGWVFPL
jgi:hypothetical protein